MRWTYEHVWQLELMLVVTRNVLNRRTAGVEMALGDAGVIRQPLGVPPHLQHSNSAYLPTHEWALHHDWHVRYSHY